MKNIAFKLIIISCLLQNTAKANSFNDCHALKEFSQERNEVVTEDDIIYDHNHIILNIMTYFKKIIDIKFKTTTYLEENKEIYGRYESLREKKEYLITEGTTLYAERISILDYYKLEIEQINPNLSQKRYTKLHKRILKQRRRDLKKIERKITRNDGQKEKMLSHFLDALAAWSPYQNYLEQLEKLELSLEKTVTSLSKIVAHKMPIAPIFIDELVEFKVPSTSPYKNEEKGETKSCSFLLEQLMLYEKIL